jgi:hypothetical protein
LWRRRYVDPEHALAKPQAAIGTFHIASVTSKSGQNRKTDTWDFIQANDDVWLGWAWWAAGPLYTDYMFSIEPGNLGQPSPTDSPVMPVLQPYFAKLLPGDYNFDGIVNQLDYDAWKANFGNTLAGAGAGALAGAGVPEPGAIALLAVGCSILWVSAFRYRPAGHRRRRCRGQRRPHRPTWPIETR